MSLDRAIVRFDIGAYLKRFGAQIESKTEWALICPTCAKQKLIVNLTKKAWHCWYCQERSTVGRGGLLALIQLLENIDKSEAVKRVLAGFHDHVTLGEIGELQNVLAEVAQYVVPIPAPSNWRYGSLDYTGILPYCEKRGISYQDVVDYGLLWCAGGKYDRRLIFPVWEGKQLVYWQARAMWEGGQNGDRFIKALNPPKMVGAAGPTDVVMNLERARHYKRVTIVEGPIDCIHTGPDSVCTFGKKISPLQIEKMRQAGVQGVDLMWDGPTDSEPQGAWPEMFKVAPTLSVAFGVDVRLVFLPKGDPGDYTREQLRTIRQRNARRLSQFSRLQEV